MAAAGSRDGSGWLSCVMCGETAVVKRLKLLPCLHLVCAHCLTQFLRDNSSSSYRATELTAAIFTCRRCSHAVQLTHDAVDGLTDASFLAAVASVTQLTDSDAESTALQHNHTDNDHCAADDVTDASVLCAANDVTDMSVLLDNVLHVNHSHDVQLLAEYTGDAAETSPVNSEKCLTGDNERSPLTCHTCGNGRSDVTPVTCGNKGSVSDEGVSETRSKLRGVCVESLRCVQACDEALSQTRQLVCDADARRLTLRRRVTQRAERLCQQVRVRRGELLAELDREHSHTTAVYSASMDALITHSNSLQHSRQLANALLTADATAPDELQNVVLTRLQQLVSADHRRPSDVTALRLDVPDTQHDDAQVDKLFGSLVKGSVGAVEMLTSFNTELQWPVGFVVTRGHESVLVGKCGAFADKAAVLFYDSRGTLVHRHALPASHLPVSVVAVASGYVLVSDVSGTVTKFSLCGRVVAEWGSVFEGASGHLAVSAGGHVLVTSAAECCVHRYDEHDGRRVATYSLQWPHTAPDITALTVNSDDELIVTASNLCIPYIFTSSGLLLSSCSSTADLHNGLKSSAAVALPSAVCCDAFDNILVADFLGNCVHFFSRAGSHLGRVLTKADGIACPTLITVDHDARLYVGQYGGDVAVFRYLSYVKHV